jgi:protein-disulfide isomerase
MKHLSRLLLATALAVSTVSLPVTAASFDSAQKAEMEKIIRSYLLDNPELLREMADKLEMKDKRTEDERINKALVTHKDEIFKTAADPKVGSSKPDVTIVEFMDYNCGWCKKSVGEVTGLVKSDKNIKVVFKDFPIFGEHSEYAAKAALAAEKQGKYWQLHQALYAHDGQVTTEVVNQVAGELGLDIKKLQADIGSKEIGERIAANMQLAKDLGISGTPAFIIDDQFHGGYLPLDGMNAAIAEVRAKGCKMC